MAGVGEYYYGTWQFYLNLILVALMVSEYTGNIIINEVERQAKVINLVNVCAH